VDSIKAMSKIQTWQAIPEAGPLAAAAFNWLKTIIRHAMTINVF
jgi:hypothetical protein